METRMDIQEKIDAIIDRIGGRDNRAVPIPARHLWVIAYGRILCEQEENCRQLHQNLVRRYKRENAFQMVYFAEWQQDKVENALIRMKENYANGFVRQTNRCYIPIVFLMEDEMTVDLLDFIFKLRNFLDRDGSLEYDIDIYGLVDYSKEMVSQNWSVVSERWAKAVHHEIQDFYLLSKGGMALHNIYTKAIDAIEMNIFLRVCAGVSDRSLNKLWQRETEYRESVIPYECEWKAMSYWKMDILVCAVCKHVLDMLESQIGGDVSDDYELKVKEKLGEFINREIESRGLLERGKMLPVPEKKIWQIIRQLKRHSCFFFKKPEDTVTVGEVLRQLYGSENFFQRYAEQIVCIDDEKIMCLVDEVLALGTYQEITGKLKRCVQELLERERKIETQHALSVENGMKEPVFSGAKTPQAFIRRMFDEVIAQHYSLYLSRERRKVLERFYTICASKPFEERLEMALQQKRDRISCLNAIINSNMPQNGIVMMDKMNKYELFDAGQKRLTWTDDVFEVCDGIGEIKERVENFVKEERMDIIEEFRKGIYMLHDGIPGDGNNREASLYVIEGNSLTLEKNRREYLFGNDFFMNLGGRKEESIVSRNIIDIKMYSDEAFYPYTLEFLGLNDSVSTIGVKGMHNDKEEGLGNGVN